MKKQMSLFIWAVAMFGMSPVWAATNSGMRAASSADLTGAPATRSNAYVDYEKYQTRSSGATYTNRDANNIYYTQPAKRSDLYKEYASGASGSSTQTIKRTTRAETVRTEVKRKYYLAHPFFQPLKGKFGSVTDFAYTNGSYQFGINQTVPDPVNGLTVLNGLTGKWDMSQFMIKEDFSYGITERLAIMGMLRYDSSTFKFDWTDPAIPDDETDDSGINMLGLGLQWRFIDDAEWIGTLSGYYQHEVDTANSFILDLKGGYKIGMSTLYGLVRGWYVSLDGNAYGNGVTGDEASMFIAYQVGDDSAAYFEGGLGIFSVLEEDWTLNVEGVLGNYDWHNQASIKAAIGWQPGNSFALNLYGKMAVYDSADGKNLDFYWQEAAVGLNNLTKIGTVKVDDISEWSIGLQAILYF